MQKIVEFKPKKLPVFSGKREGYISVFSYGFTTSGDLVPPQTDDSRMIQEAWNHQVTPFLVLTPFDQTGMFNNYLISAITNDQTAQQNLIDQMFAIMEEKGFAGIDIDFEYILVFSLHFYPQYLHNILYTRNACSQIYISNLHVFQIS